MGGAPAGHGAWTLREFLSQAATLAGKRKSASAGPQLKDITAYNAKKTVVRIRFDRDLDPQFLPAAHGLTFNPAKTVSDYFVSGSSLWVTVTAAVATGFTVAYVQQSDGVRSTVAPDGTAGVKAAAFSATVGTIVS